jgi:hypothetical protein
MDRDKRLRHDVHFESTGIWMRARDNLKYRNEGSGKVEGPICAFSEYRDRDESS